jgi:hypothetical protein
MNIYKESNLQMNKWLMLNELICVNKQLHAFLAALAARLYLASFLGLLVSLSISELDSCLITHLSPMFIPCCEILL